MFAQAPLTNHRSIPDIPPATPQSLHTVNDATSTLDAFCRDLRISYRLLGDDELLAELEALDAQRHDLADEYDQHPAAKAMWMLRWFEAQTQWQRRVARYQAGQLRRRTVDGSPRIDWPELVRQIRQQHDGLMDLLTLTSYGPHLTKVGYSRRRLSDEYAGGCPVCGGEDRFRCWPEPPGAYWCRRCGISGSVLDAYQLAHPAASFFETCRALADELGLPLPLLAPPSLPIVEEEVF